jgi:hypothetical protein
MIVKHNKIPDEFIANHTQQAFVDDQEGVRQSLRIGYVSYGMKVSADKLGFVFFHRLPEWDCQKSI